LYKQNTFQMLLMSGEIERLGNLLEEQRIESLFLKGPILASELYSDISLRTCNDIDLLIPQRELGKMDALLKENGYVKDDYIQTILGDWKWRHHHVAYYNYEKGIKLEVHWRLNPGPSKEPSFYELWKRKRKCSLFSSPVYYLGREDLFYFLVTHGARHGWSRLRWLVDISQLLKQEISIKQTNKLMRKYKILHLCGQAVILASQLIGTELKGEEIRQLVTGNRPKKLAQDALFYIKQMINLHSEPLPIEVSKYHKYHLFSLMSFHHKILFILSFLYPYPEDAITLPLPKKVHFLYFPLRPILWAWRRVRKFAFTQEDIK
ncbi:nucleotidyltransferase domain-containing protein, partial [Neobacillus drentensis]|uniref:nucleotidyltransferase domain-containing protein n=1 Tax=Neobacillus drentensis TaxID=220684 RepID=UPI002FFFC2D5